jgi:hypothetical protein
MLHRIPSERKRGDLLSQLLSRERGLADLPALAVHPQTPSSEVEIAKANGS